MTYIVQRGAVFRRLHHLDRREITNFGTDVGRQRDLGQTEGTGVGVVGRTRNLEWWHDGVAHVEGNLAESHIDIDQGRQVALEPAGLDSDSATGDGPLGAVASARHTTAWGC